MRAAVLAIVAELDRPQREELAKGGQRYYALGASEALSDVKVRVQLLPLAADEWRAVPGAENPHGLPVEPLPAHGVEFRGWISIGGGEFEDHCELVAFETPSNSDVRQVADPSIILAHRPAAAGPGEA